MTRARAHRAWQHSGGDPTASAQSARVILADPNTEIFQHLVKTYQGEPDKYVESYLWVKKCIEKGQVIYTPVVYKNPGGRRPGEEFVYWFVSSVAHWLTRSIGEHSSPNKMKSTSAIGLLPRFHTRKPAAGQVTGYTSSCAKW